MATRILFIGGQEQTVTASEDQVVQAVRRDHPNPVKLENPDGVVVYVNWSHVMTIAPQPEPASAL
jgi:hypothetical protein